MISLRWRPARYAAGQAMFSSTVALAANRLRSEGGTMSRLDDTAVEEGLQRLPGWERRGNQILKTFVRKDFAHAITFVTEVADAAEAAGHHPDIDIRWNKVTLALSSHAEGGLTDSDFQLAARIQELDQPTQPACPTGGPGSKRSTTKGSPSCGTAAPLPEGSHDRRDLDPWPWPEVAAVGVNEAPLGNWRGGRARLGRRACH